MSAMHLALLALATYRVSRLVTTDLIFARCRGWLAATYPRTLGSLVQCDWCTSIWTGTAGAVVLEIWGGNRWVIVGFAALAVSAIAGLVSEVVERLWR